MQEQKDKNASLIMIVDDVDTNRFVLKDIIEDMGCRPVLAENGVQALKMLQRLHPQMIILDIAMPEMDGYEVCQIIKKDTATRDIPVIFISAFNQPEDVVKGFSLGGEDYITKPFIPEVVRVRVGLHLRLSEVKKDLQETNRQLQQSINEQVHQIEMEKKNMLYALTRVARENAAYDEKNMDRIAYNCRVLAEAMQLSEEYDNVISDSYVETIELSAPLCDLGNVSIPTAILQKHDLLDAEEAEIIRRHPEVGARILNDIENRGDYNDFVHMSKEIAHYHHENWDGTGYPTGISGDDIPLSAQIVGIVSAFCALTEDRTYRKAYEKDEALRIMTEDSGKKYNPKILSIMQKIARQLH